MTTSRTINGVNVSYIPYIGAWGKQPRGTGLWAFFWGNRQDGEPHFYRGTLAMASRMAANDAKAAGHTCITLGS